MATQPRTYKPKTHIILDLECLSLDSHAAIIHIGAVAQYGSTANQVGIPFEARIRPSQYLSLTQFAVDQSTVDFHNEGNPGYLDQLEQEGVTLAEAMDQLVTWATQFSGDYDLHVWMQGKDYDYPILNFAARELGMQLPWKYRNVHCLRDLVFLNPAARYTGQKEAEHTALADATWAWKQFNKVIAHSNWYQRLFN